MTATAPRPKTKAAPIAVPAPAPAPELDNEELPFEAAQEEQQTEQHQKVIDLIKGNCLEMSFTVHSLPKSRRITGKQADDIATSVKGKRKGIRSSWSMFTSEHPAIKELNAAIRDLDHLRDTWTIVRSAEAKKGDSGQVSVEPGKRLIWSGDVEDFHNIFVIRAKAIDLAAEKLQFAMNNETRDDKGNRIRSIKDIDKENAGEAWDESVYPKDVTKIVGVAKDRDDQGNAVLDEDGNPRYILTFHEYRVSEKLTGMLQKRAEERLDSALSGTIETAMQTVVTDITEEMSTLMNELVARIGLFPRAGSKYSYLTEHGEAEAIKVQDRDKNAAVPAGHVRVLVKYKVLEEAEGDAEQTTAKVTKWLGPMPMAEYATELCPQTTGEKKKIYPTVIEGMIAKLQAFRDKKARMLGEYGANTTKAFEDLLQTMTRFKGLDGTNADAAQKLAGALRSSDGAKADLGQAIADTIERLNDQVTEVKKITARRRQVKMNLVGQMGGV